jgi:two-component system chemotaxis sensor kinase CheA
VGETEIESLCQGAETALSALRHSRITFSRSLADLIFLTLGRVNAIIEGKRGNISPTAGIATTHDLITALELAATGEPISPHTSKDIPAIPAISMPVIAQIPDASPVISPSPIKTVPLPTGPALRGPTNPESPAPGVRKVPEITHTIHVSATKMEAILIRAEELIARKESLARNVRDFDSLSLQLDEAKTVGISLTFAIGELQATTTPLPEKVTDTAKAANLQHNRKLAGLAEQNLLSLKRLDEQIVAGSAARRLELHTFDRQVDALLSEVRDVMLVPAASVLMFLPLTVQEMAASTGKEAGLVIEGGDLLVDRRILEAMKDPLIHLARNAVDHGIELPEERSHAGKPARGKITVSLAEKGGNRIELAISDDGRGIDFGLVKAAAQKSGIAGAGELEQMDENGIIRLLFRSGLSTSPIITDLSGRGLGLSIVEERVEMFDGDITVQTREGKGTRVQLTLPVRLATLRGVIVQTCSQSFIIPRVYAEQVFRLDGLEVRIIGNSRTIRFRDETIPLISLSTLLRLPRARQTGKQAGYAAVVTSGSTTIALEVDKVIREQELSQKSLGPQLTRVRNISGAAIGTGGRVIPVLNIADLVKTAVKGRIAEDEETPAVTEVPKIRRLLVVEDSITARTLLKNILGAAGYEVKTAVDGMDAWTILKTDMFDLVVSDVEMPRMNGFDLTTAIRHDRNLAELPVILVTALSSRDDRERGIDAGANAYIVKSSFDQSDLLDVLRRLIG